MVSVSGVSDLSSEARIQAIFDYQALDAERRALVLESARNIKSCLRRAAKDIWRIGQNLSQARSCLPYGQFVAWLQTEFEWTPRTAYNFINVFETFHDFEKFSKLDAAVSALYLLAAPSTSQEIRDEFLQRALSGEKITHKNVQKTIKASKSLNNSAHEPTDSFPPSKTKPEIVSLIKRAEIPQETQEQRQQAAPSVSTLDFIQPGWYSVGEQHYLFCGDTASLEFSEHVPPAALALAITSDDWDHDWLIEQAKNILILEEAAVYGEVLEKLLLMFSNPGEIVIFPYLPIPDPLIIGHKLNRRLYLGDSDPRRCIRIIKQAGLEVRKLRQSGVIS